MITQSSLRQQMITQRSSLDSAYRAEYQSIFDQRLLSFLQGYESIALYCAVRNEISVDCIMARESQWRLSLPMINSEDALTFVKYDAQTLWQKGKYGISEPISEPIDYVPDVFLVPLTAIDHMGTRMGMGKGYYDRYLHALVGKTTFVGVGWDFQLLNDELERQTHDVPMNYFISPSTTLKF